ncbi:MAG: cation:proton antiporter, partial [Myxococcota bacterium]
VASMIALAAVFVGAMVLVVRPLLARVADRSAGPVTMLAVLAGLAGCSWATHAIGVHEVFGAFIVGAVFPRGHLSEQLAARLGVLTRALLPMFFVITGLGVDVGGIGSSGAWQLPLILVVACAGKLLGGALGARSRGLAMRESLALGVLMSTRGLTELVVLAIGLQAGVLDAPLFTMLVVMALVTTVATGPLLDLIRPDPFLGEGPQHTVPSPDLRRVTSLDVPRRSEPPRYTARR